MPIRQLPPLLVNQIAAGEVIERPASVVKELIENSIDAGAKRIDVAIEQGGQQLIRISDDGHGIPPEELPLALTAHATSKLQTAEQLAAIDTMGFRGEALASIASVSRLRLSSRTPQDESGHLLEQSGDKRSQVQPHAMSPGTVIEIRDLFFNTPARRKFMRTASTEYGHIADTVNRVAMVHPHIAFTLSHNDRKTLDLPPHPDHRERCVAILGKELDEALLEFSHQDSLKPKAEKRSDEAPDGSSDNQHRPPSVWGLVGEPSIARGSAKFQYLCINGRPVKDRNLAHAVKESFRGLIAPDRHPVAVVLLELDPHQVDVNVHPTKAEVRFRNPSQIHGLVLSQIRQRLLATDLVPSASFNPHSSFKPGLGQSEGPDGLAAPQPANPNAFVDYFKKMDPTQKGFVYEEVRREMSETELFADSPSAVQPPAPQPQALADILQFKNSYVVTQDDDGLIIVDQHALHERIMFEQLRQRILVEGQNLESQRLLMPALIDADAQRQSLLDDLAPLLTRLGIEAEPMGPMTVAIHSFATLLFDRGVEPVAFVTDLLDQADAGNLTPQSFKPRAEKRSAEVPDGSPTSNTATNHEAEAALHTVLDMMSCKAAVKAGDALSPDELSALMAKRHEIERSSSCPHGRPTTIRLTLKDLEKQFHRT